MFFVYLFAFQQIYNFYQDTIFFIGLIHLVSERGLIIWVLINRIVNYLQSLALIKISIATNTILRIRYNILLS